MKVTFIKILTCVLISLVILSCSDDDNVRESPEVMEFLQKFNTEWQLEKVEVDETNVSQAFEGLKVTFTNKKTFVVENPVNPIWPEKGKYLTPKISGTNFIVNRVDDVEMIVTSITEVSMVIEIVYQTAPEGRTKSIAGRHRYSFVKL